MLKITGHPLVDVGAATIAAFVDKRDLSTITKMDLKKVAKFLKENYVIDPLKSFLTVAFPNSGFTNPAFEKNPRKRVEYADEVLFAYEKSKTHLEVRCVFLGIPAVTKTFRQHVPLLTGEDVINFHPYGEAGLPLSGEALLCIQALPLGCAKCAGRLLAVHSDNFDLTFDFAAEFLRNNRRALDLAQKAKSKKLPEAKYVVGTLLIDTLMRAETLRKETTDARPASLTAYHLTNSGQGVALDIYHLPLDMMDFLQTAVSAEYRTQWDEIAQRAWQLSQLPKKKSAKAKADKAPEKERPQRNMLYEDIFKLPDNARPFLQTYFLRTAWRYAKEDDPRKNYSLKQETHLVSWKLTELFLRKVMHMDKTRIGHLRELGDRLAEYVAGQNDRRFFTSFFQEGRYDYLRNLLIKANTNEVRRGGKPLITFEQFIEIFEEGEEVARPDWRLARDLVLIRMVEQLHEKKWFAQNLQVLEEVSQAPENSQLVAETQS
ncbi:MAG: type I-B CRISPR-associated protein Cas8b1/Cst1 [candidate division KSB1 bacterium]|nr:type I-B CRISPR-associated protein Cas8b1/Cst1 [candidate division KSB1 bacterium]